MLGFVGDVGGWGKLSPLLVAGHSVLTAQPGETEEEPSLSEEIELIKSNYCGSDIISN